jgi:dihydroorotase
MSESLLIAGARLLDPATALDAKGYVGVRDGVITHVGRQAPKARFEKTLKADGQWLIPGIVDLCARLREPGATHKATIRSESLAAQAGGITTLCIPPTRARSSTRRRWSTASRRASRAPARGSTCACSAR